MGCREKVRREEGRRASRRSKDRDRGGPCKGHVVVREREGTWLKEQSTSSGEGLVQGGVSGCDQLAGKTFVLAISDGSCTASLQPPLWAGLYFILK
eukprot:1160726-Pelagomonas_calceolata.AAC.3